MLIPDFNTILATRDEKIEVMIEPFRKVLEELIKEIAERLFIDPYQAYSASRTIQTKKEMPYLALLQKAMQEKASQLVHSDFKVEISIKNDGEPYDPRDRLRFNLREGFPPIESHVRLDVKIHKKTTREHLR